MIIPVYNGERVLADCLDALTNQDWRQDRLEIIIVDDGSTDGSAKVVNSYPVTYYRQENAGPATARTLGMDMASGDILLFTDADCIPNRDWVSQMVTPILENSEVIGVKASTAQISVASSPA